MLGYSRGVTEPITSPTFTLVRTYDTPAGPLHHADIYRLEQLGEVADLALGELAEFNGIVLVEWGDVVSASLGEHLEVRLEIVDDEPADGDPDDTAESDDDAITPPTSRLIRVTASGPSWATRWSLITERLGALDFTDSAPC